MQPLTTYIKNPELLDASAVEELFELVDRHPTFQAARLLLLRGLYQLQDERFGPTLRQAALMVPDRARLFDLIEGGKFRQQPEPRSRQHHEAESSDSDRTRSLIDNFLSGLSDENPPKRPHVADATTDYMAYLLQQEDASLSSEEPVALPSEEEEEIPEAELEASLDDEEPEDIPVQAPRKKLGQFSARRTNGDEIDEWPLEEDKDAQNAPSEAYFTETLARIYIKQGKYDKAIEIIRRLSLNYPKKSRYFADQIRFLGKLILNERSKNEEK